MTLRVPAIEITVNDLKRISLLAIVLIVVLRIAIGWQFFYEGLWKYDTLDSAQPWTAEGYLKAAQGPLRDEFRSLTGDPNDLGWLDYERVSARWDDWRDRFVAHYGLDDDAQQRLEQMLEGKPLHVVAIESVPPNAETALEEYADVVQYDKENGRLIVHGDQPLLPTESAALQAAVDVVPVPGGYHEAEPDYARRGEDGEPLRNDDGSIVPADPDEVRFYQVIERLQRESGDLGYRQRLAALLKYDPDRVGVVGRLNERNNYDFVYGTVTAEEEDAAAVNVNFGKIRQYVDELQAYERALDRAERSNLAYEWEHVEKLGRKLASLRAELVGPVRALEAEMKEEARRELTPQQLVRGALPPDRSAPLYWASTAALYGLLVLGALLMVGLLTRLAAFFGALMLIGFYLVIPPWPGVPQPETIEHSLIVNKNLIEALALLAIAALPTGSWFGLDGLFRWLWRRKRR